MTLIVVTNTQVIVDSKSSNPMGTYTVDKRIRFTHSGVDYVAAGAGEVSEIEHVVAGLIRDGLDDFVRAYACKSNTEVFIRRLSDNSLFTVRAHKDARVVPYFYNAEQGVEEAAGSGYYHFWAYFQEHGDVMKAFELTCQHCDSVGLPIRTF